jgi:hypothetical protein
VNNLIGQTPTEMPFAVSELALAAITLPFNRMLPLSAVDFKATLVPALIAPVVLMSPAEFTAKVLPAVEASRVRTEGLMLVMLTEPSVPLVLADRFEE